MTTSIKPLLQVVSVVALLTAGLIVYSQLVAYWGDESLHLVAAQLINAGRRPYLNFFYQHPPVFVYVLAITLRIFGRNWHVAHALSALFTSACALLIGLFILSRFKDVALAAVAALLFALNVYVISFGTVALPYGWCLFMMVAAFLQTLESVKQKSSLAALLAGLSAGAAAGAYLLAAPCGLVLFIWLIRRNESGRTMLKAAAFLFGVVIPFVPLIALAATAGQQVWSDLIAYHMFHRAGRELDLWFNLREIAGWFISIQGLVLVGFALVAVWFRKGSEIFDRHTAAELDLLIAITLALSATIALARPVSSFYFVLITPFLSLAAAYGVHSLSTVAKRQIVIVATLSVYLLGGCGFKYVWRTQTSFADHRAVAEIARVVDDVTRPAGIIYAFEAVYFEAGRLPPPGLENRFNPKSLADEWLKQGRFDTVCISSHDPRVREFGLLDDYRQRRSTSIDGIDFYVLWDKK